MFQKVQLENFLFFLILASFSFVLMAFTQNNGLYAIQIMVQFFCAILFLLKCNLMDSIEIKLFLVSFFCFIQYFINPSSFRISTCVYTFLFIATFIVYRRILYKNAISLDKIMKWIRMALILYSVVLLIQQVQSLLGMPIFNLHSDMSSKFKVNSLTSESSNLAIVVPAYFFSYIKLREIQLCRKYDIKNDLRTDLLIWFLFLYLSLSCGSMSGFIATAVIMIYFINKRNAKYVVFTVIFFLVVCIPLVAYYQVFNFARLTDFFQAIISFNPRILIDIDPSAACRIIPYWVYFQSIDLFDWHFYFGYGIDYAEDLAEYLILTTKYAGDSLDLSRNIGATNITAFFCNYGVFAAIVFLKTIKNLITEKWLSYEIFLYISVFSIITVNHRLLWLFLMLMTTVKYFQNRCISMSKN